MRKSVVSRLELHILLTCMGKDNDMDLQKAWCSHGLGLHWLIAEWRDLSDHDFSTSPGSRLWLDDAYLRLPYFGAAPLCEFHRTLAHTAIEATLRAHGLYPSLQRASLPSTDISNVLLLL